LPGNAAGAEAGAPGNLPDINPISHGQA